MHILFSRRARIARTALVQATCARARVGTTVTLLVASGLLHPAGALGQSTASSGPAESMRCMDTSGTITPARLDSKHLIYVEQETVVAQKDGRVLVAGRPVFVWRDRADRHDLLAVDSLFGMVIDSVTSSVRAIPSPLPGRTLDGMRAAALPDGWWLVTFAEVVPRDPPQRPLVERMWSGETDGARWRRLQQLPVVADSMDVTLASALAWRAGRARLALPPIRAQHRRIVLYALDGGRWSVTRHDLGLVSYVALALTPSHDMLAAVRTIEDSVADMNSLFVYRKRGKDTLWGQEELIVRAGLEPVRDPLFASGARHVLSWRKSTNAEKSWDAWFTTFDDSAMRVGSPTRIASRSIELTGGARGDRAVWATYDRAWPDPVVQLVESDGSSNLASVERIGRYRGLLGMAVTRNRVVLVAALAAASSRDPSVVSMVETHTWRCR
jgi:hypothetical protein